MKKLALFICLLFLTGCSVGMAMSGKDQKDDSILYPGAPRDVVIAKLGPPESSTTNEKEERVDSYYIVKGNKPSTGRAVAHAALDVFTFGLWEVIGTPMEMGAGSEEHSRVLVIYDKNDKIKDVKKVISPKDKE